MDEARPERRRSNGSRNRRRGPPERWSPYDAASDPNDRHEWRRRVRRFRDEGQELVRRGRRLASRFRRPLIGLSLLAASIPASKAARQQSEQSREAAEARMRTQRAAARPGEDIEDRVGEVWSEARSESVRAAIVDAAVRRYAIPRDLAEDIHDEAVRADIHPQLAFGLVKTESSFRTRAVSHVGARGLTQVMPRTARWLEPGVTAEDLFDRRTNLRLGFRYLRELIEKYDGDVRLALLAYNRGPGTVDRVIERGGDPDNGYADRVLGG